MQLRPLTELILISQLTGEPTSEQLRAEFGTKKLSRATLTLIKKGWLRIDGITETGSAEARQLLDLRSWQKLGKEGQEYCVEESIHGTWLYHIRQKCDCNALCGGETLIKELPMEHWGVKRNDIVDHWYQFKYCSKCWTIYKERTGIELAYVPMELRK
jgi:hypothetical protein